MIKEIVILCEDGENFSIRVQSRSELFPCLCLIYAAHVGRSRGPILDGDIPQPFCQPLPQTLSSDYFLVPLHVMQTAIVCSGNNQEVDGDVGDDGGGGSGGDGGDGVEGRSNIHSIEWPQSGRLRLTVDCSLLA